MRVDPRPRVWVVIVNWNGREDTLACLRSLESLDYRGHDVLVVDNGSQDGSVEAIRASFPSVTVMENGRNLGFAGGNNVGIAHAVDRGADYVLLLNSDTEVAPGLLSALVEVGEADPTVGMLGPKIYYYDAPNVIWSAGGTVDAWGRTGHLRADEPDDGSPEGVRLVDYVTGCAILVKRCVVERIGAFDERFFAYFEETEWCARARRAGYKVAYVPSGVVWHKIQPNARGASRFYIYMMARNRLLYLRASGARSSALAAASLDLLRTAAAWSLRPRHAPRRAYAGALVKGVADFAMGRFGPPTESVTA